MNTSDSVGPLKSRHPEDEENLHWPEDDPMFADDDNGEDDWDPDGPLAEEAEDEDPEEAELNWSIQQEGDDGGW